PLAALDRDGVEQQVPESARETRQRRLVQRRDPAPAVALELGERRVPRRHTAWCLHTPETQNSVFATPRPMAVSDSASQIPNTPSGPDHQAARGIRKAVSTVPTSIGQNV